MATLTFTEFIPAHQSKTGKTVPPKVKTADGTEYACGKDVHLPLVIGQPYECIVNSKPNGQYINHYLDSAVPLAAPVAAPTNGHAAQVHAPAPQVDVQRLIVKQSCLKAAVDLVSSGNANKAALLTLADALVDWVYGDRRLAQQSAAVRNPGAPVVSAETHPSRAGGRDDDDGYWSSVLADASGQA